MKKLKFYLVFIFALLSQSIVAQSFIDGFSVNPKLGSVRNRYYYITSHGIELNVLKGNKIYSVDYIKTLDYTLLGSIGDFYRQVGVMMGGFRDRKMFRVQYQGGIAPFWGVLDEKYVILTYVRYRSDPFFTVGLVGKLGVKFVPARFVSLGLDLSTNINIKRSILRLAFSVEVGILKPKKDKLINNSI